MFKDFLHLVFHVWFLICFFTLSVWILLPGRPGSWISLPGMTVTQNPLLRQQENCNRRSTLGGTEWRSQSPGFSPIIICGGNWSLELLSGSQENRTIFLIDYSVINSSSVGVQWSAACVILWDLSTAKQTNMENK